MKLAVTFPEETEQVGAGLAPMKLLPVPEMVHDLSWLLNPWPDTVTFVPTGPLLGETDMEIGTTVETTNVPTAKAPLGLAVTLTG